MIVKCGACGQEMELTGKLSDGQHVVCPFCGEKTAFCRPTRIEIPVGAARVYPNQQSTAAKPTPPKEPQKPKLGIRRTENAQAPNVDLNAQAIVRKIQEDEDAKRLSAEKARTAKRQAFKASLIRNGVIAVVVAIVAAVGLRFYIKRNAAQREREIAERERIRMAEEEAQVNRESEQNAAKARELHEREQQRQKREAAQQQREKEEAERKLAYESAQKAAAARNAAMKAEKARYHAAENVFARAIVMPWSSLPNDKRPGAVDGKFTCACPGENGRLKFYEVESKPGEELKVQMLSSDGNTQTVKFSDFDAKLSEFGGVVNNGETSYVIAPKVTFKGWPIPSASINPAKLKLEDVYALMKQLDMSTKRLSFEVRMTVREKENPVSVKTVAFGDQLNADAFEDILKPIAKSSVKKTSVGKAKKQTVVMYDGKIIRRQADGVTLVPVNPNHHDDNWYRLRNEAARQEQAANASREDALSRYNDAVEQRLRQLMSAATMTIVIRNTAQ